MDLDGARVLLTGGSRGIGPHIARALLARGASVTLAARSAKGLDQVARSLGGDRVATVAGDVTNEDDRAAIVADAETAFGPIDVLVNNAGIDPAVPAGRAGDAERRRGHIVNVASLSGKTATPYNTVYATTKHGLIGFTYSLRAELHGTGVSASAVCPAFVSEAGFITSYVDPPARWSPGALTDPRRVARAVVRAIERDKPDAVVAGALPQIADVSLAISPRLTEFLARRMGGYDSLRREAAARTRRRDDT